MSRKDDSIVLPEDSETHYPVLLENVSQLLTEARRNTVRAVNSIMTVTYWQIGRYIVEFEQGGQERAQYGAQLLERLSKDLTMRFGRGFGYIQLNLMRQLFLAYPKILQSLIEESDKTPYSIRLMALSEKFPLSWTHYVRLLRVSSANAREFYEKEALRGGWSVRQLDRQIQSQFYERCLLSKNKAAMLAQGAEALPEDRVTLEQEIKDPLVLEFLDLKDPYTESELEDAIILRLQDFLMEMGPAFTFVDRQRKLRIGDSWYKIDLLLYHRVLRCLVIIDLKIGKLDHADTGQMITYVNYADVHWKLEGEKPPVGLILCAQNDEALARYALAGKEGQIRASEYHRLLPDEEVLQAKLIEAQQEAEQYLRMKALLQEASKQEAESNLPKPDEKKSCQS